MCIRDSIRSRSCHLGRSYVQFFNPIFQMILVFCIYCHCYHMLFCHVVGLKTPTVIWIHIYSSLWSSSPALLFSFQFPLKTTGNGLFYLEIFSVQFPLLFFITAEVLPFYPSWFCWTPFSFGKGHYADRKVSLKASDPLRDISGVVYRRQGKPPY